MSSTTLIPVEEYLRSSEKPNAEYRDGEVLPKAMPTKLHSLMQRILIMLLEKQGANVFPELTVRVTPTRFLVPDVSVARDFPGPYPTDPVQLCCEILSPDDRIGAMLAKCEEYHAWGVPFCWVVDPVKQTAWEYHNGQEPTRASSVLRAGDISIALDDLFSAIKDATPAA